ncbi:MAG: hypothetical protein M3092_06500 [Actinomycetia bacterium]|nr:hypothetical protein [Actinomycetes bacterium]
MVWIAGSVSLVVVVLEIATLVNLVRYRHHLETWQVVLWAVFIVVVPLIGMVSYLMWRVSRSDAMTESIEFQDKYSKGNRQLPPKI